MIKATCVLLAIGSSILGHLNAWEDDPRIDEHNKLTDRLLKQADDQMGVWAYEDKLIEENEQKAIKEFVEKTTRRRKHHAPKKKDSECPVPDTTIPSPSGNGNG